MTIIYFFTLMAQLSASSILDDAVTQLKNGIKADLKNNMTEVIQDFGIYRNDYNSFSSDLLLQVGEKHMDQIIDRFSPVLSGILFNAEKNEDGKYYTFNKTSQLWQRKESVSIPNGAAINSDILKSRILQSFKDMISARESHLMRRMVFPAFMKNTAGGADYLLSKTSDLSSSQVLKSKNTFKSDAVSTIGRPNTADDLSLAPDEIKAESPNTQRYIRKPENREDFSEFLKKFTPGTILRKAADDAADGADYFLSKVDEWAASPVLDDVQRLLQKQRRYRRTDDGDIYDVELRKKWREKRKARKEEYRLYKLEQSRVNAYARSQRSHGSFDSGFDSDDGTVVASGGSREARQLNLDRRDNTKISRKITKSNLIPLEVQRLFISSLNKKIMQVMDWPETSNALLSYTQKI